MNILRKIGRAIATNIPGSEAKAGASLAKEKKELELLLRSGGLSRKAAVSEVARRFKNVNTL